MVQVNNYIAHTSNSLSNNVVVQLPPAFNFHQPSVHAARVTVVIVRVCVSVTALAATYFFYTLKIRCH